MSNTNTVIKAQAGDKHHIQLAVWYHRQGVVRTDVLAQLKQAHYTLQINDEVISFNAISVLGIMLGMELAEHSAKPSLDDAITQVNSALGSSELKWTKAKLIHRPSIAVK